MMGIIILLLVLGAAFFWGTKSASKNAPRRRVDVVPRKETDVPFPRLLKTGDAKFDAHCERAWAGECFAELSEWYIKAIAQIDDLATSAQDLEYLRVCRRNQILCNVLSRATSDLDLTDGMQISFYGAEAGEQTCRYCSKEFTISLKEYLKNPDVLPCADCCSKGRKYCCMTIISWK